MIPTLVGRLATALTRLAHHLGTHDYLATGCLHGHHDYCQGKTGQAGAKTPAQCKFCAAACRCRCHAGSTPAEPEPVERCIHSKHIHQQHHHTPVAGCPWCQATPTTTEGTPT